MLKEKRYLCLAILLFLPLYLTAYETNTDLVNDKIKATKSFSKEEAARNNYGSYSNPQIREPSLRDSGRNGTLLFINKSTFRFVEDIGFYVPKLVVALKANNPADPVIFDDPASFSITPLQGEVVLSGAALEALMNKYVFAFENAPLRGITVSTQDNLFILGGEMNRRNVWVPFSMEGTLTLSEGHILKYVPHVVIVDGNDAGKVLKAANVRLDELLTVHATGADLVGSTIVLDTLLLFPPPKLHLNIATANVEKRGLVLTFNESENPEFPASLTKADSSMIVKGGDVKFLRTMPVNALAEFQSLTEGKEFDFNLYHYREQLAAGYLKLREDGAIMAYMRNYNEMEKVEDEK